MQKKRLKVGGVANLSREAFISPKPDVMVMTTNGEAKKFEERLLSLKRGLTYSFRGKEDSAKCLRALVIWGVHSE